MKYSLAQNENKGSLVDETSRPQVKKDFLVLVLHLAFHSSVERVATR